MIFSSNIFFVNNETLVKLYKIYARPYLDYASVVYSPNCLFLTDTVECVQRHFNKRLHNLCNLSYVNRLKVTALESLKLRRFQTDLSVVYKILHAEIDSSIRNSFVHNNVISTRGNCFKLYKNSFRLVVRKYFFTCRVIDVWNSLDNVIVCCKLFKDFNEKLKNSKHLECFLKGRALISLCLLVPACMFCLLAYLTLRINSIELNQDVSLKMILE